MAKTLAKVFGVVFILVGLLGFIPNPIVGDMALFHTDMVHNVVHIVLGLILVLCKTEAKAKMWLKIEGVLYVVLAIVGFMMVTGADHVSLLGIVELNSADNWLHLVLGIVLLFAGMAGAKKQMAMPSSGAQM